MTNKELKKVRERYRNRYHLDRAYVNRWLSMENVVKNNFESHEGRVYMIIFNEGFQNQIDALAFNLNRAQSSRWSYLR